MSGIQKRMAVLALFSWFLTTAIGQHSTHIIHIRENRGPDSLVQPLLGVISGPDPCVDSKAPDLTPHLQEIGITSIRNNDYWDDRLDMELMFSCPDSNTYPSWQCDPNDPSNYNWTLSDAQFQSYMNGGFEPFFRIGGEYQCGVRLHDYNGPRADEEQNWIEAAVRVVKRYNNWHGAGNALHYLNIHTEFPNPKFWDRKDQAFFPFWVNAYRRLKAEFPDHKIGGPGFTSSARFANDDLEARDVQTVIQFLEYLYQHDLRPDWLGWHIFNFWPENYYKAGKKYRQLLDGSGIYVGMVSWSGSGFFDDTELICDAYNLCSGGVATDEQGQNAYTLSVEKQDTLYNQKRGAALLTAAWISLQLTDVIKAYYYRCGDPESYPDGKPGYAPHPAGGAGLFYGDKTGTYKPMAHAVRFWSEIVNNYPLLLQTDYPCVNADSLKLYTLAAKSRDATSCALLVSNPEEIAQEFTIELENIDRYEISYSLVNDTETGLNRYPASANRFRIESETVILIRLFNATEVKDNGSQKEQKKAALSVYPNPANAGTTIEVNIPAAAGGSLFLYNIRGQIKQELFIGRWQPGRHRFVLRGNRLSSGVYFIRLEFDKSCKAEKFILLR
ncbi:T9SS type A sorting domain-containing protein [candidate division KSB1 bacterium]|nr:T9SS type A sorting domain-containing protein [candidate division KSB1 bacterium]